MKPYVLRVMWPGSDVDVAEDFTSDKPFGAISVGDLIDLEEGRRKHGLSLLRVVRVQHGLYQGENVGALHRIRVYTEAVPDAP